MYRPASNWNGYRADRYPTGAQRELVRSLGPHRTPAAPQQPASCSIPLPAWLPDCE